MPIIRQLPQQLVNQIAAGEVIERPASVVKELVENSLDAGSRRVEVTIMGGGSELIRISDDGCGMTPDQLPLAIASHATSKLPDEGSLFHIETLGFRGEAMASIASVSQLTIRSRAVGAGAVGAGEGAEIVVRGGHAEPPMPCGCPVGTVVEVRNLFFNTPVRRKFMRTPQTESGHITEAFTRLALAYPHVHMVLRNGDRVQHDLPPTTRWAERIAAFFGPEVGEALIRIDSNEGEIRVSGYACEPSVNRGNPRMQYLFLNGRHIRDRSLQHALGEAYRGLLMVGRHPVCFLRLDMPADMVDVNVHPTKLEVRFTDSGRVYARLLQTLRHQFLTTDMTMRVGPTGASPPSAPASSAGSNGLSAGSNGLSADSAASIARVDDPSSGVTGGPLGIARHPDSNTSHADGLAGSGVSPPHGADDWSTPGESAHRQQVIAWAKTGKTTQVTARLSGGVPEFRPFRGDAAPWDVSGPTALPAEGRSDAAPPTGSAPTAPHVTPTAEPASDAPTHSYLGMQIHNRYLVTQDDSGMVVIDQHALHERVMYERIRGKVLEQGGRLETQRLLVPEPVSLTPAERVAALDARDVLAQIGLEIDDFGGDTILISGRPVMLPKISPGDLLRQAIELILGAGKDPAARDLLDHLLHSMACKAAVKAGDRLTQDEITSLLEQRDLYQDTHHCPHGRPTALFFSRDELDRMFGRLGPRARPEHSAAAPAV
ncbi:MAG: DNA mismatch repair endonuclease MutL [Planctomycetaceae bacterium]|nr:MAG: DNA mismatch repair endonuclease MutL [Planctomycetaceae bacterium]